jgi:hypothetical protein
MRARHGIIAFVGLGFVASLACSRNANQQNFIGAKCAGQNDCPAELICANEECRERCNPDQTCPKPAEQCIANACWPAGKGPAGSGDDGGRTSGSDGGDPFNPDGGDTIPIDSTGTEVVTGIKLTGPEMSGLGFYADDTHAMLRYTKMDINGTVPQLTISGFGSWTPAQAAALNQNDAFVSIVSNRIVYTKSGGGGGGTPAPVYARPTNLSEPEAPLGGSVLDGAAVLDGTDFAYVNGSKQVRVFDAATGAVDTTDYGTVTSSPGDQIKIAKNGTVIAWLVQDKINGWKVYAATKGSPGALMTATFPGTVMFDGVYVVGTKLYVVTGGGASNVLYEKEMTTADPAVAVNNYPASEIAGTPVTVGSVIYFVKRVFGGTTQGTFLAKFDLATKTETVSTSKTAGDKLAVTENNIYVFEDVPQNNPSGGQFQTFRVAKFPKF